MAPLGADQDPGRARLLLSRPRGRACPYANICEQCDNFTTTTEFGPAGLQACRPTPPRCGRTPKPAAGTARSPATPRHHQHQATPEPARTRRRVERRDLTAGEGRSIGCGYRNQANYARRIPCTSPPGGQCDDGQHGVATLHREEPVSRPRRRAAAGPAQPLEATVEPAGSRGQPDIASDAGAIALAMSQARPRRHEESGANAERNVDHGY